MVRNDQYACFDLQGILICELEPGLLVEETNIGPDAFWVGLKYNTGGFWSLERRILGPLRPVIEHVDDHAAWMEIGVCHCDRTERVMLTIIEGYLCLVKEVDKVDWNSIRADVI
jgi:hypothetical protein